MLLLTPPRSEKRLKATLKTLTSRISTIPWLDKILCSSTSSQAENAVPEVSGGRAISEKLLALLASSAVRKGSLEQMQFRRCHPVFLRAIDRCVRDGRPVQLTLMGFPFKVPNPAKVGKRYMPDLAELAALVRLRELHVKSMSIYPPGLEIHIIHDGTYIAPVFDVALEEVLGYESYFSQLVNMINGRTSKPFIKEHDFQALAHAKISNLMQSVSEARKSARRWHNGRETREYAERFNKTLGMMNLRRLPFPEACRLLNRDRRDRLPDEYGALDRQVHVAMIRYYLRDFLLHEFDPRPACFRDAIHMTTQCRPGRLAIWLVHRGCSLLPWHGVGVIDGAGKCKVALACDVLSNPSYRPVFVEGEDTPFFYRQFA
jgi:pyoverdine/dityrosine biosynthesis protein Dit1